MPFFFHIITRYIFFLWPFYFPTQTYTNFTLKTFKGQFTIKVRTCSLEYLLIHLLKDCNFVLFSLEIYHNKTRCGYNTNTQKHKKSLSCTRNDQFGRDNKKIHVIIYNKNKPLFMPFATKELKFKEVWKHYDTLFCE